MLPYFEVKTVDLGFMQLSFFGILVVTAILTGLFISSREARLKGLEADTIDASNGVALITGLIIGHAVDVVFYNPSVFRTDPIQILYFWRTMSSLGSFVGGTLCVVLYLAVRRKPVLRYCDCMAVGLVVAIMIGRIGCTLVHDHIGQLTNFPLAFRFPDGARHDLGFYELILLFIMVIVIFSIDRKRIAPGRMVTIIGCFYMTIRFFLDFLRIDDARYAGLTPAQYGCLGLGGWCAYLLVSRSMKSPAGHSN